MIRRLRAFIEWLVPWYDPAAEARHNERSHYIRERSIQVRIDAERRLADSSRIRRAYRAYGDGFQR